MPARKTERQVLHAARATITYANSTVTFDAQVPSGSMIVGAYVDVTTLFNAGTTNVLTLGDGTTADRFLGASDVTEGTAGAYTKALADVVTSDTSIVATYAQTGTAATTGAADIVLLYYPHAS